MDRMRINTLYEGHYRSIEEDFLQLTGRVLAEDKHLTVVSAGTGQLDRLRKLLLEQFSSNILGGVKFLPGIEHLARSVSSVPVRTEKVSHSDRTLCALHSMKDLEREDPLFDLRNNTDTAHSMGNFFENLFERGITAGLYKITSMTLSREQTTTEKIIGHMLNRYEEDRNGLYFSCGDMILEREFHDGDRGTSIFYGFYDLNPAQRRFLKRFMKTSPETYWFSPVSENSQWNSIYLRTRMLLQDIGIDSLVMSGSGKRMNGFAEFFESLPKQPRPPVPVKGFRITAVSGELGACRTVLGRIRELEENENINPENVAVIRRKQEGESLIRLAHHEGIPINAPLKVKLSDIPEGRFVLDLLGAANQDLYYVFLEALLASGILKDDYAADPCGIADIVTGSGIRMGLAKWRDWYSSQENENRLVSFLRKTDMFFSNLPDEAVAAEYLGQLEDFFWEITSKSIVKSVKEVLFDPGMFRFRGKVSLLQFSDALGFYYRSKDIILRKPDQKGFRVMSIEKVRGNLFDSVLLMDMEEGIYPGIPTEDPRLGDELRSMLQMTPKSVRETEDGFLLRQAGEAALRTLDIVYRERNSAGSEISPSPFISAVVLPQDNYSPDPAWFKRTSSSPLEQLLEGSHPGQGRARAVLKGDFSLKPGFVRAFNAENSRMDFSGFDEYDGIILQSGILKNSISPTFLEKYMRCPFAFLLEEIWKIDRAEIADISGSPDPLTKGSILHETVEEIIEKSGFNTTRMEVESVLKRVAVSHNIDRKFATEYLLEIFFRKQTETIVNSLGKLSSNGWKFLDREKDLNGHFGELKINGRIDLIMEDSDSNLVLLDLKTGKLPDIRDMEKGKLYQLPFYYILARENYPGRKIASVAYASISDRTPGKLSSLTGNEMEDRLEGVRMNAERAVSMIREGLFPPVPTSNCEYCSLVCRRSPYERIRGKAQSDVRVSMLREIMLKK